MCGRFTLTANDRKRLGERFGAPLPEDAVLERFNVAPTEPVLVVRKEPRVAQVVRWGLIPPWTDTPPKGAPLINARVETVFERRPFADLAGEPRSRCLVIADGFYEWMRPESPKARRVPVRFARADGEPFAFAGLYCRRSCTILTCTPNAMVTRLHDRMPVILAGPGDEAAWLTGAIGAGDLPGLCRPLDAGLMAGVPASPRLNRAGEEGPDLLVAEPAGEQISLL